MVSPALAIRAGALWRPAAAAIHAVDATIRAAAMACQGPVSRMLASANSTTEIAKPIPAARGSDPVRATAIPAITALAMSSRPEVTAVTFS